MAPVNIDVLAEQVRRMQDDLAGFKKDMREEVREICKDVERIERVTSEIGSNLRYMTESINKMEAMMKSFISVVGEQNTKINDFVNSDKRMDHKKQLIVSALQVLSGILIALLTFWASNRVR